ncbi:hypothetical protein KDA14_06265, partial [Candidatus Saccharibacteria bacterium]|nr:hypothetical protein [Candidatus Saccharibacteria bacterium]
MAAKKKEAKKPVSKSRKPRKPHTEQHAGKAEMLYRITEVFRYMLQAKPRGAICQIMANKYDMSERQTSEYIRRARIMLAEKLDEEIELSLQYHLKARQNILDQSVDMG